KEGSAKIFQGMIRAEGINEYFMNDLELQSEADPYCCPIGIKIGGVTSPPVDRKLNHKKHDLSDGESKKGGKVIVQPAAEHDDRHNGLQHRLQNPERKLDLGAGHFSFRRSLARNLL